MRLPFFFIGLMLWGVPLSAQHFAPENWKYLAIDSTRQKWGDWDEPEWLRYFGTGFSDVNRDGLTDVGSGRYVYLNPGGDMTGPWKRITLEDNVDIILCMDVDGDPFADLIAQALPDVFWYEAIDESGAGYTRRKIAEVPATSHVNSQGFTSDQLIPGGREEILIAGNGDVYAIVIPENPEDPGLFPVHLVGKNTSDEGIGTGDIDGDGDIDFACGRRPEGSGEPLTAVWFENPGHMIGNWNDHVVGSSDKPMDRFEVADLDNDGQADIVVSEERYPGLEPDAGLYWFKSVDQAHERWEKQLIVTQYSMNNLDAGDIDSDGDIDLVTNEHKGSDLELQIWENDGKGQFTCHNIDSGKENHLGTQLVDLDGDGDLDIAGAAWDNYRWLHVWRNETQNTTGTVFRAYHWDPSNKLSGEDFLRVGGKLGWNGAIRMADHMDLKKAVRAELILEKLQSHDHTTGLRAIVNGHPAISIPPPATIPDPAEAYMHHDYPVVAVPLAYLEGGALDIEFLVDPEQRFNWPQVILYGISLRVYYSDDKSAFHAGIQCRMEPDHLVLSLECSDPGQVKKVDYMGWYEDVNIRGDGIYRQWQYNRLQTRMMNHIASASEVPYAATWNTSWVPNQPGPVKLRAQVETLDGLIHLTPEINTRLPDRDYRILLVKPYDIPENWVTRESEFSERFYLPVDPAKVEEAILHWRSWSPCYSNGILLNGTPLDLPGDWPCYTYYEHEHPLKDLFSLKKGENTLTTLLTPLKDGQMVHGMEVQWPGIQLKIKTRDYPEHKVVISETEYEGRPHFRVESGSVTWYYDRAGGGFSRMIDPAGRDWISYRTEPWGTYPDAAASSFRGLPNLVFGGGDDGAGHPGHDACRSWTENGTILTESKNGKWRWKWTFESDHARLQVEQTDPVRNYWFLYEGVPGGQFTPDSYFFGTSEHPPSDRLPDFYQGETASGNVRWIYAGDSDSQNTFYMVQCRPDSQEDIWGFLGNTEDGLESSDGMTVFGFGRNLQTEPLLSGPGEFVVGFFPGKVRTTKDHELFARYAEKFTGD